jgi:hypothetical protein
MVPGVNPPTGTESEDIRRPTRGASAEIFGASAKGLAAVGIIEIELRGWAQELQNRLSGGFEAEHFGHCITGDDFIGSHTQHETAKMQIGKANVNLF